VSDHLSKFGLATGILLAAALVSPPACAQSQTPTPTGPAQQPPPTVIKIDVNQVLVPVVVTDKHGHSVTGLTPGDFEVLEDGAPQRLTAFSTETDLAATTLKTGGPSVELPAPSSAVIPQGAAHRTYIICLDTLNSSFGNLAGVVSALEKLFKREEGSDSKYALVALGRQPMVIRDLTRDPNQILSALQSKELTKEIGLGENGNLAQQETELNLKLQEYCERCPCAAMPPPDGGGSGSDQVCAGKRSGLEIWAGAASEERSLWARSFLGDMKDLVNNLCVQPGKRILILVSDGFTLRPGRDLFGLLALYFQIPSEELQNPGDSLKPAIDDIVRLATAHDVTFYTLDSRGLYASAAGALDASQDLQYGRAGPVLLPMMEQQKNIQAHENQDAMTELAVATGGVFFHNSNDLLKGLRQAFADGREYYVLAYSSSHKAADGKFREIRVDVRRKDVTVRAKQGYWAPGP
jgi:VWFA-related protein